MTMNDVADISPRPAGEAVHLPEPWAERLEAAKDWLTREGASAANDAVLFEGLCEAIRAADIPLARATSHIRTLHSERIGITHIWRLAENLQEIHFPHGAAQSALYYDSPVKVIHDTQEWLDVRLDEVPDERFSIIPDLRAEGITHYLMGPLIYSDGGVNALSYATDRPGGFEPEQAAFIKALIPAATPFFELRTVYRSVNEILRIYVGREPGNRILAGQIERGNVNKIHSAMLFCDLRNFTALSTTMSEEDLVALLNDCYDCIIPAVTEKGGEILKFLGDGVLAIFADNPSLAAVDLECARRQSCEAAFEATTRIQAAMAALNRDKEIRWHDLSVGIALHYGQAAYGNIGAGERLDFTVIGKDVNLTSRISRLSGVLSRPILASAAFATAIGQPMLEVGSFELKGIEDWQPVFAPA